MFSNSAVMIVFGLALMLIGLVIIFWTHSPSTDSTKVSYSIKLSTYLGGSLVEVLGATLVIRQWLYNPNLFLTSLDVMIGFVGSIIVAFGVFAIYRGMKIQNNFSLAIFSGFALRIRTVYYIVGGTVILYGLSVIAADIIPRFLK